MEEISQFQNLMISFEIEPILSWLKHIASSKLLYLVACQNQKSKAKLNFARRSMKER
jgi:hypothetical protein